jgi:hypothetical protein
VAVKKSELYSKLWASCDELRGGMDASQYKDYVLVLLFIKYISDKYAGMPYAPIQVHAGASFKDMVALKGKSDIGDQINKKSSPRSPTPTSSPKCRTSTMPTNSAPAKTWWTGSPTSSPSSKTRPSTSPKTAPKATTALKFRRRLRILHAPLCHRER